MKQLKTKFALILNTLTFIQINEGYLGNSLNETLFPAQSVKYYHMATQFN